MSFNFRNEPKLVTWDLKVRQMGLQKKDLANIMVKELDLTCTPQQYLDESEKLHKTLFPEVCIIMVIRVVEFPRERCKLERFLPKNQHTQRKLLNFENWWSWE